METIEKVLELKAPNLLVESSYQLIFKMFCTYIVILFII
jgi:hypothetical protein